METKTATSVPEPKKETKVTATTTDNKVVNGTTKPVGAVTPVAKPAPKLRTEAELKTAMSELIAKGDMKGVMALAAEQQMAEKAKAQAEAEKLGKELIDFGVAIKDSIVKALSPFKAKLESTDFYEGVWFTWDFGAGQPDPSVRLKKGTQKAARGSTPSAANSGGGKPKVHLDGDNADMLSRHGGKTFGFSPEGITLQDAYDSREQEHVGKQGKPVSRSNWVWQIRTQLLKEDGKL